MYQGNKIKGKFQSNTQVFEFVLDGKGIKYNLLPESVADSYLLGYYALDSYLTKSKNRSNLLDRLIDSLTKDFHTDSRLINSTNIRSLLISKVYNPIKYSLNRLPSNYRQRCHELILKGNQLNKKNITDYYYFNQFFYPSYSDVITGKKIPFNQLNQYENQFKSIDLSSYANCESGCECSKCSISNLGGSQDITSNQSIQSLINEIDYYKLSRQDPLSQYLKEEVESEFENYLLDRILERYGLSQYSPDNVYELESNDRDLFDPSNELNYFTIKDQTSAVSTEIKQCGKGLLCGASCIDPDKDCVLDNPTPTAVQKTATLLNSLIGAANQNPVGKVVSETGKDDVKSTITGAVSNALLGALPDIPVVKDLMSSVVEDLTEGALDKITEKLGGMTQHALDPESVKQVQSTKEVLGNLVDVMKQSGISSLEQFTTMSKEEWAGYATQKGIEMGLNALVSSLTANPLLGYAAGKASSKLAEKAGEFVTNKLQGNKKPATN